MITDIKAKVDQRIPNVLTDGNMDFPAMSKVGQLYTADWKLRLIAAGMVYKVHIGAITAGADVTQVTGGGAGTVPDIEQPEIIVGVDLGYYLIPLELDASLNSDTDAPDDYISAMLLMDRTQSAPTSATATVVTPINLLDGGAAFPGRAFKEVTADIADPVLSDLLFYRRRTQIELVLNGSASNLTDAVVGGMDIHWEASLPNLAAGPCSMVFWYAGTVAVTGLATMTFAAVPASWFPIS